jgi:uncharacterized surface protein with fasciclin (FAS1) repeats
LVIIFINNLLLTIKKIKMKLFNKIQKAGLALAIIAMGLTACNKLDLDAVPNTTPAASTLPTLATLLDDANFSLLKAAVNKAGLMTTLANKDLRFTVFAPDDAAITASLTPLLPPGVTPAIYINNVLTAADAKSLISYHVVPQVIGAASITSSFPNFQYPSILNPAPTVSPLLRLTTFPSKRANGAWVNNVPITAVDIQAANGVVHKVARIVQPPSTDLWSRINTDAELTYLKAAIQRADSGVVLLQDRLQSSLDLATYPLAIGSNLTVFAPTDAAMKAFLTGAITQALVGRGIPLATSQFAAGVIVNAGGTTLLSNPSAVADIPGIPVVNLGPILSGVITPTLAKGIVAYHLLSSQSGSFTPPGVRVFSVNIPTSATNAKTLLNAGVPAHPGLTVQATFIPSLPVVGAATVKGAGNATASNILINLTGGAPTSDLHHINGVLHKIDQVLLPQ